MIVMVTAMGMNVFAEGESIFEEVTVEYGDVEVMPFAGCGNYVLKKLGVPYCSNENCPGGSYNKRFRIDLYERTCVMDDSSTYKEEQTRREFIACNCVK